MGIVEDAMFKRLDELRAQGLSEERAAVVWGDEADRSRRHAETPSPVDDEETRAFIEGWNARIYGDDFDKALHFWNRRRCGI